MRRATKAGATTAILAGGYLLWILAMAPKASAIPAFARKYQTSCATCHNNYPELNDFGEAFKRNGFKFPKDDDSFVKEPPVLLGAKAQKEVFPNAIYPGEIPGSIPISFRYSGNFNYNSRQPDAVVAAAGGATPRTDLFVPNTLTIIAAGSFGQNISFWIDNDISAAGSGANGGLGDGYLKFDVGHYIHLPSRALNIRFGQFELDLPFSQARTIYPSAYDIFSETPPVPATTPGQTVFHTINNPFFLATPQRGVELGGYANSGNFTWSVAVSDGTNSAYGLGPAITARNTKDVYLRVSQRFNLERDPQSRDAVQAAGSTGPRDHTSIRLGGFYYHGTNESNVGSSQFSFAGTIQDPFYRVGGDVRFKYRKMELFGVGMLGHDSDHVVDTTAQTVSSAPTSTYAGGFAGGNFWIHPWMIAYMRYDFVNSLPDFANGVSQYRTRNRYSPGFQLLVRTNIKIIGEYQYRWGVPYAGPTGPLFFRPNTFVTGIDYSF